MAADDELDRIAAEYALGVLSLQDRQSVERRMLDSPELEERVSAWQRRLDPLAEDTPPLAPSPEVWRRLQRSVAGRHGPTQREALDRGLRRKLGWWRGWALGATAAAAGLAALVWVGTTGPPMLVAVLNDASGQPVWVIRAMGDAGGLLARGLTAAPGPDRVPELWLLAPGAPPLSLGVLDPAGTNRRDLPPEVASRLGDGVALAISLEPPGGSPVGAPTGPVVSTGMLLREP